LKDYAGSFETRVSIVSSAIKISLAVQDHSADRIDSVPPMERRQFGSRPARRTGAEFVNEAKASTAATIGSSILASAVQIPGGVKDQVLIGLQKLGPIEAVEITRCEAASALRAELDDARSTAASPSHSHIEVSSSVQRQPARGRLRGLTAYAEPMNYLLRPASWWVLDKLEDDSRPIVKFIAAEQGHSIDIAGAVENNSHGLGAARTAGTVKAVPEAGVSWKTAPPP